MFNEQLQHLQTMKTLSGHIQCGELRKRKAKTKQTNTQKSRLWHLIGTCISFIIILSYNFCVTFRQNSVVRGQIKIDSDQSY